MTNLFCDFSLISIGTHEEGEPQVGPVPGTISATVGLKLGPTIFGLIRGNQANVTSQIAAKFSLDAFVEVATGANLPFSGEQIVQKGLREANKRVFDYSTKMLAASRVTSTGLFAMFDGTRCTVARTGDEEAFLWRKGELTQLFKVEGELSRSARMERFIGANKQLLADLATLKMKVGDVLWISNSSAGNLRAFSDIQFDELTTEGIGRELLARLRSHPPSQRGERIICGVFLFENPPILLKKVVEW